MLPCAQHAARCRSSENLPALAGAAPDGPWLGALEEGRGRFHPGSVALRRPAGGPLRLRLRAPRSAASPGARCIGVLVGDRPAAGSPHRFLAVESADRALRGMLAELDVKGLEWALEVVPAPSLRWGE